MPIAELIPQGGGWRDEDIAPGAGIAATKVIHQTTHSALVFGEATSVAATTYPLTIINAETAEIVDFEAVIFTAMGASRTVTIDLHKSTAGGAFATILSSTINLSSSSAVRTAFSAVVSDVDLVEGDILRAVVTLGGSGTAPQGLLVGLTTRDRPTA